MGEILVKDLMVRKEDYATVLVDYTVAQAMVELEEAQERYQDGCSKYHHRALLVAEGSGRIVGKLSMIDVLRALVPEPKQDGALNLGFSQDFVDTTAECFNELHGAIASMCGRLEGALVSEIMTVPTPGEYVDGEASLDVAIQQITHGHHQSLLVTGGKRVVGILRLTDIFSSICGALEARSSCK